MKDKTDLENLVASLHCPVNVIMLPGIPDFKTLQKIGVARVSLGPGFLKIAIKAMKDLAIKLKNYEGFDEVISNDVTSEFVKNLVNQKSVLNIELCSGHPIQSNSGYALGCKTQNFIRKKY